MAGRETAFIDTLFFVRIYCSFAYYDYFCRKVSGEYSPF